MSSLPSNTSLLFDTHMLEQLACPMCFGALRLDVGSRGGTESETQIVCVECRRSYPLIDGIPVLIPERATLPDA